MRSAFLSGEIPAVIPSVSIDDPKECEGPSILEVLTGMLMVVQSRSIACRLFDHSVESGELVVKKLSR